MPRPRRLPTPAPASRFVPAGPGMIETLHQALRQPQANALVKIALDSFLEGRGLGPETSINIRITAAEITVGDGPGPAPTPPAEPAVAS